MVAAAGRAISERGLSNIRIKDIADQAAMSVSSVLYYYPELDELLVEVHADTVNRYFESREVLIDTAQSSLAQLLRALEAGIPRSEDDHIFRLLYEMHGLGETSDDHAALMQSLYEREVALYEALLERGVHAGDFHLTLPLADLARCLVALEDGFGLHVVSRNAATDYDSALELLQRSAATLVGRAL
jgi:AcrR family transcriptional regulator